MFHIRKLTKQRTLSFLAIQECCSVFSLDNHDINWLIINLVFVFIMLLNEPRLFTFHSLSRKNTTFLQISSERYLPFLTPETKTRPDH